MQELLAPFDVLISRQRRRAAARGMINAAHVLAKVTGGLALSPCSFLGPGNAAMGSNDHSLQNAA
jgi:hypothetical protein